MKNSKDEHTSATQRILIVALNSTTKVLKAEEPRKPVFEDPGNTVENVSVLIISIHIIPILQGDGFDHTRISQ